MAARLKTHRAFWFSKNTAGSP